MTTWIIIGLLIVILIVALKICKLLESIKHNNEVLTAQEAYNPINRVETETKSIDGRVQELEEIVRDLKYEIRPIVEGLNGIQNILINQK